MSSNNKNKAFLYASTALVAGFISVNPANAEVVNGTFVEGSGTFNHTANKTTITVHDRNTIANFNQYNIGAGQGVHYNHDLGSGAADHLSRVTGGSESRILGSLTSDKVNIFLVNPNGVFFGKDSIVDVPKLIVSTSDITNANFKNRNYRFDIKGNPKSTIINKGKITIQDGGLAALVAPGVENDGVILANKGTVILAGGEDFTLDMYGDKMISFAVSAEDEKRYVKQSGEILAQDGYVALTVQDVNSVVNSVVNMDGIIEADTVKISGDEIILGSSSKINASSKSANGNGGRVEVIAKDTLSADGEITAKGTGTGKGGFVETSAEFVELKDDFIVDTSAESGEYGTWLLDPRNYKIHTGGNGFNQVNNVWLSNRLATNNVVLATGLLGFQPGDFRIEADVTKTSGASTSLSIFGWRDVIMNNGVTISSTSNALNVSVAALRNVAINGDIKTNGGNFTVSGGFIPFTNPGIPIGSAAKFTLGSTGSINTKAGTVSIRANEIETNGKIDARGAGGQVDFRADGDITINDRIRANNGTGDDLKFVSDNGDVNILAKLATGSGTVRIEAANGEVNLDGRISSNGLSGDTDVVNVLSNKGTINQGIEIVNVDGTVNLGTDTFEQTVSIDKNISLVGAGAGLTIIAPTTAPAQEFKNFFNDVWNRSIIQVSGADANISGLTVDGTNAGDLSAAGADRRFVGIGLDNAGGTIDNVTIANINDNNNAKAWGIYAESDSSTGDDARTLTVQNSDISNTQKGTISAGGDSLTVDINNNTLTGSGAANSTFQHNVLLHRGTAGVVNANTITNNLKSGSFDVRLYETASGVQVTNNILSDGGADTTGVSVERSDNAVISGNDIQNHNVGIKNLDSLDTEITGNTLTNNITGVAVIDPVTSSVSIHDQTITGGTTGLLLDGPDAFVTFGANVAFDGQTGQYISLVNTAVATGDVDATAVTFDGVNGATATDAELVAIEDKINHEMDNNTVGLVTFKDGVVVATTNNSGIQQGVDSASTDDTVLVAGGTYDENVKITKDLTLIEAEGTGDAIIAPTIAPDAGNEFTKSSDSTKTRGIVLVQDADVTIRNITIDGAGIAASVLPSRTRIAGIALDNAGGLVRNVTINNIANAGSSPWAVGIHADSDSNDGDDARNLVLRGNEINDFQSSGIIVGGDQLTVDVRKNDLTASQAQGNQRGIWAEYGVSGQIRGNKVEKTTTSGSKGIVVTRNTDGLSVTGNKVKTSGGNIGIEVSGGSDNTILTGNDIKNQKTGINIIDSVDAQISNNKLANNTTGIALDGSNATISDQTISGGITGLLVDGSDADVTIGADVAFNGQSDQYIVLQNTAIGGDEKDIRNVAFDGTLADNMDDAQSFALEDKLTHKTDDVDTGLLRWRDNVVFATVDTTIQGAVDAATAGDTVLANAGNYDESVLINKDLTLTKGDVAGDVIIAPTAAPTNEFKNFFNGIWNRSIVLAQNADVNISNITVDGSGAGDLSAAPAKRRLAGFGFDNAGGTIDNVTITNIADNKLGRGEAFVGQADALDGDTARSITIQNSDISNYQSEGISLDGGLLTADINNNTVTGLGGAATLKQGGILLARGATGSVDTNTVSGNTISGSSDIWLLDSDNSTITNNTLTGAAPDSNGVLIQSSDDVLVGGNDIQNHDIGLNIVDSVDVQTVFNNLSGNTQGIYAEDATGLLVALSTINNNTEDGVHLRDSDNALIGFNQFDNNKNGIRSVSSDTVQTALNFFTNNERGIYASFSDDLSVDFSFFGGNENGIRVVSSSNGLDVTNSLFIDNTEGVHLSSSSTGGSIADSDFIDNSYAGVHIDGADNTEVTRSYFEGNNNGVYVDDNADNVTVRRSEFFDNNDGIEVDSAEGFTAVNSTFDNNGTGIYLRDGSDDATVRGADTVFTNNDYGIYADDSENLTVRDSEFRRNLDGIHLETGADDATIRDSLFVNNDTGIHVDGADDATVVNSDFRRNDNGIFADDNSDDLTVRDSRFRKNIFGIQGDETDDLTVVNSVFRLNTGAGIYLRDDSDRATVRDSRFFDNAVGINAIQTSANLTVNNAEMSGNGTAIALNNSDDATVVDSDINNNTNFGIDAVNSEDLTVRNTDFTMNQTGIRLDTNSDFATVSNSRFTDNTIGIDGVGADNLTVNSKSSFEGHKIGVRLKNSDDNRIVDSAFNNNGSGIYTEDADRMVVRNSTFEGNGTGASLNDDSENNTFRDSTFTSSKTGIYLDTSSDFTTVNNTDFIRNGYGINAQGADNITVNNGSTFRRNNIGINLKNSDDNRIVDARFTDNDRTQIGIQAEDADRMVVRDSVFNGNDIGANLTSDSEENTFNNTRFVDNRIGLQATGGSNDLTVNNGSVFRDNRTGIRLEDSNDATIVDSRLTDNRNGLYARRSDDLTVKDTRIDNNRRNGAIVRQSEDAVFNNVNVHDNADSGIRLRNADNATINNGSRFANNEIGVEMVNGSDDVTIRDSRFITNETGVSSIGNDRLRVVDSVFRNNTANGVYANDSADLRVSSTNFNGNQTGILLEDSDNARVTDNSRFVDNETGIQANSSDNLFVRDSIFRGNTENGIALDESNDANVRDSRFVENENGIYAQDSDGFTVTDSRFIDNVVGLFGRRADALTVAGSTFNDNRRGLKLRNSDDAVISDSNFNDNNRGIVLRNGSDNALIRDTNINGGNIGLLVDGRVGGVEDEINITLRDVIFGGDVGQASIQFQNATLVGGVDVSGVELLANGPAGWRFENVSGDEPLDSFGPGDLDFNDTVFGDTYTFADIELSGSTMDGFAENVTFVNDGGNPFNRELRVFHSVDDPTEGTIFYEGLDLVRAFFGNIFSEIANRTDLAEAYYNALSTAGKAFDTPGIDGRAGLGGFNNIGELKVSLNSTSTQQLQTASADQLNNLATASGADPEDFNNLTPGAGNNYETGNCEVNFANDFLGEDVLLAGATGSCQ